MTVAVVNLLLGLFSFFLMCCSPSCFKMICIPTRLVMSRQ